MQIRILLTLVILCTAVAAHAQLAPDTVAMLDNIMKKYADGNPGAQLAISRNGQVIYSSVRGMADLEHNVPLKKTSKTEAGSVSKQFTAAAILLLEHQGKLSLNDDVRKHIPEFPDYGHTITIRHLMQHTSGLKDWGSIAEITGWPRGTKAYNNNDALEIIVRQKSLNNIPGAEYIYSNSGYTTLVHIVQRVSGMSHAAFTKQNLFEPAGMTNTEWRDDYRRVVPDRAIAYAKSGSRYVTNMPNEDTYGHGALLTTAEDLLKWNDFYLNGKLAGPALLQRQITTNSLNNGKMNNYGAGLSIENQQGLRLITHSGATASYRANLDHFPATGLSIAWLSNTSESTLANIPPQVRRVFFNNAPAQTTPVLQNKVDLISFRPFVGAYRDKRSGEGIKIALTDTSLVSETEGLLVPVSGTEALLGRERFLFRLQPRMLTVITPSNDTVYFEGVNAHEPSGMKDYSGIYFSEETDSKIRILEKSGKLFAKRRDIETPLTPVYKDGFSMPGGTIYFERDRKGKVAKMFISISRARNVPFKKVD